MNSNELYIDDIIEYHLQNFNNFDENKALEYQKIKKYNGWYEKPESLNQIKTFIKNVGFEELLNLFNYMLTRFIPFRKSNEYQRRGLLNFISAVLHKDNLDIDKYQEIIKKFPQIIGKKRSSEFADEKHATNIYNNLKPFIKNHKINKLLDISCGEGWKTYFLAKKLDVQAHCVDIKEWRRDSKFDQKIGDDITFSFYNKDKPKIDYKDNTFDIIVLSMVLHHSDKQSELLSEAYRLLKEGGLLYIREHDAMKDSDKVMTDIEHIIWDIRDGLDLQETLTKHSTMIYLDYLQLNYLAMKQNNFIFVETGFESRSIYKKIGITRQFFTIYQKPIEEKEKNKKSKEKKEKSKEKKEKSKEKKEKSKEKKEKSKEKKEKSKEKKEKSK
jgi:ubiquinone/menaquinone biosynthesis C-methylase UbiE